MKTLILLIPVVVLLCFAVRLSATEPGFNTEPIAPKFNDAPMVTSEFGMGLFVENADVLAARQDCPNGFCPSPVSITRHLPATTSFVFESPVSVATSSPAPGYHRHLMKDGTVIEHHDSNYGDPVAHAGVAGAGWPKYYGPVATQEGIDVPFVGSIMAVEVTTSSVVTRNRGYGVFGLRSTPGPIARFVAGLRAAQATRSAMRGW